MRTAIASILAAFAVVVLSVLPAAAAVMPHPPSAPAGPALRQFIFMDYEHGVLTTPCFVHKGEVLKGIGYGLGTYTVTSVKPHGPVDLVKLSPAVVPVTEPPQVSLVLDFAVVR